MLNHSEHKDAGERPEISRLLERFAQEGRHWAAAEVTLAQIEIAELKAQLVNAALLAGLGVAAGICMLIALSEAAIAALSIHVTTPGLAALIVAVLFAGLAIGSGIAARHVVSWRSESLLLRWLGAR